MNYVTWSKTKFWVIMFSVFFAGILIAPKQLNPAKEVVKEVTKEVKVEVPVTKEVYVDKDRADWIALKQIDDQIISTAAEGFDDIGTVLVEIAAGDFSNVDSYTTRTRARTALIKEYGQKRIELIAKLGI